MDSETTLVTRRIFFYSLMCLSGIFLTGCTKNITESYESEFGLDIPKPASGENPFWRIFSEECTTGYAYNERLGVEVGTLREGVSHWTTTAYLPTGVDGQRRLYVMYLDTFGSELETTYENRTKTERLVNAIPAGNMSVLTVIVNYPETVDVNTIPFLENAQNNINQQHLDYASDRGWSPIVHFDFTNQTVTSNGFNNFDRETPPSNVIDWLSRKGIEVAGYDYLVLLNPDPSKTEGGLGRVSHTRPFYIYIGNFSGVSSTLTEGYINQISRAAYHHEIGHYWGWDHDWSPCSNDSPFITEPELFGWTDTDSDDIPEIIDPTPYGTTP